MAKKWTSEQLAAINTRDRSLLVSAAAGSGKTATLTERIIRSLLDSDDPIDITDMLVVTFTNAAASELRERITDALKSAIKDNPTDPRLEKQLLMLGGAKIKTIDAFCNDVVRSNADTLGITPTYRIADTAELWLLAEEVIEGMLGAIWREELSDVATPDALAGIIDCLTDSGRSQEITEVLLYLYSLTESAERGVLTIRQLAEEYSPESFTAPESTSAGRYAMQVARSAAEHYLSLWQRYLATMPPPRKPSEDFTAMLRSDIEFLTAVSEAQSYEKMKSVLDGVTFAKKPTVRKDSALDIHGEIAFYRDRMKSELVKEIGEKYFFYSVPEWKELFVNIYSHLDTLCRLIEKFDQLFTEEKIRRGAFGHSDIERFAMKALVEPDGAPTPSALSMRSRFRAVYIDEYQDVNSIQNSIFEAVSKKDNRFMVGDIKQSIYGFRSAKPDIFAGLKERFAPLDSCGDQPEASVFMSSNFRCDEGIIDFVNGVFDPIFSAVGKSIGYTDGDRLTFAKVYDTPPIFSHTPEVCMIDKTKSDAEEDSEDEPRAVALKIRALIEHGKLGDGRAIRPSDIAIILRNAKGRDAAYADALAEANVPSVIAGDKSFFLNSEVLLTLCLLNSVDNPRRDIYLAGLMRSPLFDFTPDELLSIHAMGGDTLYDGVKLRAAKFPEDKKTSAFLAKLNLYRTVCEGMSADALLSRLYRETGLLALASKNGGRENLMLLYDFAKRFEGGAYRGLYSFINYINSILDRRTTFDDKKESVGEEAVNIITAHGSKGLEYPIVFVVDAGKQFRNRDAANRLAYAEDLGINFRLRTPSGLAVVDNPIHHIINDFNMAKEYEEELRVLYVALTRAREMLFVTGTCPTVKRDGYLDGVRYNARNLDEYSARGLRSYLEIILTALGITPSSPFEFTEGQWRLTDCDPDADCEDSQKCADGCETDEAKEVILKNEADSDIASSGCDGEDLTHKDLADTAATTGRDPRELAAILEERFRFDYPDKYLTELPAKLSVSALYPTVLDGAEELFASMTLSEEESEEPIGYLPSFYTGKSRDESARRGTATHTFLQFCDLEKLRTKGARAELQRLRDEKFLSPEDSERVRLAEIERFTESELFRDMLSAKQIYRELRFNLRLDAELFTKDEERKRALEGRKLLVQGVIDCVIVEENGEIRLVDYKTDRLTKEELSDPSLAARKLIERHSTQLSYYALAVKEAFGKAPSRVEIYSLPLGDVVSAHDFIE